MSDIDTAVVDSLKVLDPERPIREADNRRRGGEIAMTRMTDTVEKVSKKRLWN